MSCFMLYVSSYINSFHHARLKLSITFVCNEVTSGSSTAIQAEQALLSGGYTEAVEEWILKQLS